MDNTLLEAQRAAEVLLDIEAWEKETDKPVLAAAQRETVIMLALLSIAESLADIARNSTATNERAVKREESRERIRNL